MSTLRSYGMAGLNKDPSLGVAPKMKRARNPCGGGWQYADNVLDDIASRSSGAPAVPAQKPNMELATPIDCPCCKQQVRTPTLDIVIDHYKVTPLEARVLGAVWKGKGLPVQTERIFDAMYSDDEDGGPSPTRMYAAFKVALCHLRARLNGSGISIENVGYRRGYRLILKGV